jgi:TolB-like protein
MRPASIVRKLLVLVVAACSRPILVPVPTTDTGVRFYQARDYAHARDALLAALALDPRDIRAAVHLGLAYEGLGDLDSALIAYHRAGVLGVSAGERRTIEARVVALTRQRLARVARQALADEPKLSGAAPVPNSIAVLPWIYLGADPELKPLERGMAHLVVTDLAKLPRFTLLEREQVQALSDELALAGADRVDPATAARSGRLLRAADVLSGSIRDGENGSIRLDASVMSAATAEVRATGTAQDRLQQLFAMEKTLVFGLLDRLGVVLTPAERQALSERPTADLQSFLAFSRGLAAEDRGDWTDATRHFREASRADPSFRAAQERAGISATQAGANRVTAARLAAVTERRTGSVRGAQLAASLQNIAPSLAGRINRPQNRTTAFRSRLAEALRQDDPSRIGTTLGLPTTIIPRP